MDEIDENLERLRRALQSRVSSHSIQNARRQNQTEKPGLFFPDGSGTGRRTNYEDENLIEANERGERSPADFSSNSSSSRNSLHTSEDQRSAGAIREDRDDLSVSGLWKRFSKFLGISR